MHAVGVRSTYEGLVFDRTVRGKDAVKRVVGVGHKIVEQALLQAVNEPACAAIVSSTLLHQPIVVARILDRVTGKCVPVRSVVLAAERSAETGEWIILRDWQALRRLNEMVEHLSLLRRPCGLLQDLVVIQGAVESALRLIESDVPTLKTGFRVPLVEALVVIWPGTESPPPRGQEGNGTSDSMDDLE
jgi:hypothetical protein